MAHFCELDENNVVLQVVVIANEDCQDSDGNESESVGVSFCQNLFNSTNTWKQCSYSGSIRGQMPGEGDTYNATDDIFVKRKNPQFPSFVLADSGLEYVPPISKPDDGGHYEWDEDTLQWIRVDEV